MKAALLGFLFAVVVIGFAVGLMALAIHLKGDLSPGANIPPCPNEQGLIYHEKVAHRSHVSETVEAYRDKGWTNVTQRAEGAYTKPVVGGHCRLEATG